jgi:L-fuconolactonase
MTTDQASGGQQPAGAPRQPVPAFVDSHVHFWDPTRFDYPWLASVPALNRPFLPSDLADDGAGPAGIIVVEADRAPAQAMAEVSWVHRLRDGGAPVIGIVANAPLELGTGCSEQLSHLASLPLVVGTRRLLQDEAAGFATLAGFVEGARHLAEQGLTLDLCIRMHQLDEATELVRRLPPVGFVLDHLAKPRIEAASFRSWATGMSRLAELPNVRCKLSGLATEADPTHRAPADLLPYLRHAVDTFGPARCMFGSDWPVLTTAMSYGQWLDLVLTAVADLTVEEQDLVMRRTALAAYGVPW